MSLFSAAQRLPHCIRCGGVAAQPSAVMVRSNRAILYECCNACRDNHRKECESIVQRQVESPAGASQSDSKRLGGFAAAAGLESPNGV